MQSIILNSLDFKDFIKSVRENPCSNSHTLKIHNDGSGVLSDPMKRTIDTLGFKIEGIRAGNHVDRYLHNGRVDPVGRRPRASLQDDSTLYHSFSKTYRESESSSRIFF